MKKLFVFLISAIAVIAMSFGITACSDDSASVIPDDYSYVTIDINPSVEMIAFGNSVVEVKAANYDACVLLDGEDFSSMTIEDAAVKIVSLAEEMGYLTDSNNQVKISVISDDMQTVELIKSKVKSGAQKGSKKAEVIEETRLQDELTVKKLKEENSEKFADLTEEKLRLIESLMQYDSSLTYEAGVEMSVKELSSALKSAINENKEVFTSQLRSEYSALYTQKKQEIEREIASVYGEEYLEGWEKYTALENVYNSIKSELEKSGVSDDDVAVIMNLLGISDVSLIEKGGIVKPEYVFNYIDKHIRKKSTHEEQTAVKEVTEILAKYDAKNYVLSEDEVAYVSEALGESVSFTKLSEIAQNLSERKSELNSIKDAVNLTDEQIAQLRSLKESFSDIKESVLSEMEQSIASVRSQIAAEKQERSNH